MAIIEFVPLIIETILCVGSVVSTAVPTNVVGDGVQIVLCILRDTDMLGEVPLGNGKINGRIVLGTDLAVVVEFEAFEVDNQNRRQDPEICFLGGITVHFAFATVPLIHTRE